MSKAVTKEYKELMHYTTAAGLAGIVSSDCLWASHAAFLNDAEEIKHFFDARVFDLLFPEVLTYEKEQARWLENVECREVEAEFENIVKLKAQKWVKVIRDTILNFNQPYIFSMSAPCDLLVAYSGLLSQWRGYGTDGGYALVFNTIELDKLIKLEGQTYHYQHALWGNVHYHGIDRNIQPSTSEVVESEEIMLKGIAKIIRGGTAEETKGFYQAVSNLSCIYKHWGFQEEREIRIIVIPANAAVARLEVTEGKTSPQKPIKTFIRNGVPVPYLELFARPDAVHERIRLPITKVIVGPHREANVRVQAVRQLLAANDYEAEVVCSQIPYIGR